MDAKPLDTSPENELQSKNDGVKKLTIHLKNVKNTNITVLVSPASYMGNSSYDIPIVQW